MTTEESLRPISFRFSVRLRTFFFPFSAEELFDALTKLGYVLSRPPPIATPGFRSEAIGPVAQKESNLVDVNPDRGVLGVTGASSMLAVMQAYLDIEKAFSEDLGVQLSKDARLYELTGIYEAKTTKNPATHIAATLGIKKAFSSNLVRIYNQEIIPYALRLVPKGKIPADDEWMEVNISPRRDRPNDTYDISVIFRSADESKVEDLARRLDSAVLDTIKSLEAG